MSNVHEVIFTDKQIALTALQDPSIEGGVLLQTDREGMYQIISFGLINPLMMVGLLQKAMQELLQELEEDEHEAS
jgi:hypothetical protein